MTLSFEGIPKRLLQRMLWENQLCNEDERGKPMGFQTEFNLIDAQRDWKEAKKKNKGLMYTLCKKKVFVNIPEKLVDATAYDEEAGVEGKCAFALGKARKIAEERRAAAALAKEKERENALKRAKPSKDVNVKETRNKKKRKIE